MGRPSTYNPDTVEAICTRLAEGEPLAVICRDEEMPGLRTVYDWAEADPDVSARIARAREAGEDALAADCLLIADDATGDFRLGERGVIVDSDHIQRSKLRIDTRLKLLAKWNPKRWGDKVQLADADGNKLERRVMLTEAELEAIAAAGRANG